MAELEAEINALKFNLTKGGGGSINTESGAHSPFYVRDIVDSRDKECLNIDWKVDTLPKATVPYLLFYITQNLTPI